MVRLNGNAPIRIHDFQYHITLIRHGQIHIGGAIERVGVVLRQTKTMVAGAIVDTDIILNGKHGIGPVDGFRPVLCKIRNLHAVELHPVSIHIASSERNGDSLCERTNTQNYK